MEGDYYEALDVERECSEGDIRSAYVTQALKWHPDKNALGKKRAEKAFVELSEAYFVLSNSNLRTLYDTSGKETVKNSCTEFDLNNFTLENALFVFNTAYRNKDPVTACMQDENWYENSEIYKGSPYKNTLQERFRGRELVDTEVIETLVSKYTKSPRTVDKTMKTVIIEKNGRRVKKTITTITSADGSQEIIEEEKEEPLARNYLSPRANRNIH
jgi:DnaJ-class molecular chaperone